MALNREDVFELNNASRDKMIYRVLNTWDRKECNYTKVFDLKNTELF